MSIALELLPEEFRLGHEAIDGQHEILFQLFRELSDYCSTQEYELELEIILLSLKTYVATHFRYEEGLMEVEEYQDFAAHKAEHRSLEKQVLDHMSRYATLEGRDELLKFAVVMKNFLYSWLVNHIAKTDRKLCQTVH